MGVVSIGALGGAGRGTGGVYSVCRDEASGKAVCKASERATTLGTRQHRWVKGTWLYGVDYRSSVGFRIVSYPPNILLCFI
ncbi:hypothetical protein E2C01_091892 [Portunus trituberculatus]|uniref:Uncharacterized protein n=1 Tax=Portunus trituberculatus TaxID=210409 RepID=A0A5B7JQA9_PORTR|nr:hypothetical protein [Portunus trituberculatus]